MYDNTGFVLDPEPPRRPATEARLRAMARQLAAAGDDWDDGADLPRRAALLGLARRSLPACDQAKLLGVARGGEETT